VGGTRAGRAEGKADGLGERRRRTFESDARKAVQTDDLDQRPDLRLRTTEQDRAPMRAQPAREHRQVDHQRRVREHELREVDDDVRLSPEGAGQRLPPASLRRSILVTSAAQNRRLVIEVDDAPNLPNRKGGMQGLWTNSSTLFLECPPLMM
jgi:hypothetical protein